MAKLFFQDISTPNLSTAEARVLSLALGAICSIGVYADEAVGRSDAERAEANRNFVARAFGDAKSLWPESSELAVDDILRTAARLGLQLRPECDPDKPEVIQ